MLSLSMNPIDAGSDGRRPVYLASMPILIVGSLGVAVSRSVNELYWWRVLQAFGSGGGLSVGAGVISDIYKLEERGKAMGVFFAVRCGVMDYTGLVLIVWVYRLVYSTRRSHRLPVGLSPITGHGVSCRWASSSRPSLRFCSSMCASRRPVSLMQGASTN